MMDVFHGALAEIRRNADIVVRAEDQASSFPCEELPNCFDLVRRCFLLSDDVVESEDHHRVCVRKNPLVKRQFLPGLIDPLVHRDCMAGDLTDEGLKLQCGEME